MEHPRNERKLSVARHLRKNMTPQERHLWYDFLRFCKPRFRRQEIIGNYIVDFYCHQAKLVVEVDGSGHYEPEEISRDVNRTEYLHKFGIRVLRISNGDVNRNFSGCCQAFLYALEQCGVSGQIDVEGSFHPSVSKADSSPQGEP